MKNLYKGFVTFIIQIIFIFVSTKILFSEETNSLLTSLVFIVISAFYIYFGYQAEKKDGSRLSAIVLYILALVTGWGGIMMIIG